MAEDRHLSDRVAGWISRWSRLARADRPIATTLAGLAFVIGGWLAYRSLDLTWESISWGPIWLALFVAVPATTLLNGLEYRVVGRLVDVRVPIVTAMRVAVTGTAANLLPVPGAALVRTGDLLSRGVAVRLAVWANALAGLASLFIAGIAAAILFYGVNSWGVLVGVSAAISTGAVMAALLRRHSHTGLKSLMMIEIGLFAMTAVRAWLVAVALGFGGGWLTPLAISSVYPLAAAIGIFPGGLAVREFLAALVTRMTQAGASAGFLITAVDRLLGLIVHAPFALLLSYARIESPAQVLETEQ